MNDYKIAVIPSEGDRISYEYGKTNEERHADVLRRFGVRSYGDNSIFGLFDENAPCTLTQYYLVSYGNVIFYNLSCDDDKFGIMCVLDNVSKVQRDKVFDFLSSLKGYSIELDTYITEDGRLTMNDSFEDDYSTGFEGIKGYLDSVVCFDKVRSKRLWIK